MYGREHVANTVQANAQASCDHDRGAVLLARVRQRVQQHRGEECQLRGRPDLGGMCSVNFENLHIAEANHVQILPSTHRDLPRDTPSRSKRQPRQHLLSELATITDVMVLQMGHTADHQRTQPQQTDGFS